MPEGLPSSPLQAPFRVLVFPSINEPGLEIIQALARSNKVEVLGGSSFGAEFDPSNRLLAEHIACPPQGDADFKRQMHELIAEHRVDLVFPTVDSVVAEFASWQLDDVVFIVPDQRAAETCISKRATYERLREIVPVPALYDDQPPDLPVFAKPDLGSGSRGGRLVRDQPGLQSARHEGLMIHEYLPGDEYTVDCLGDRAGELLVSNVRLRGRVARGISVGTEAVESPEIEAHVHAIADELRIAGPWFAQFKLDRIGGPKLLEVNARVAGSMGHTRLAGVNIPLLAVFLFAGWNVTIPRRRDGVRIVRHLRTIGDVSDFDWVVWDLDDTLVRKDGKADPDVIAWLYDLHNQGKRQLLITKNTDPEEAIDRLRIPRLFAGIHAVADKVGELEQLLADYRIEPPRCILANDSVTENLAIQAYLPGLRAVMPDALDLLAREKVR